jgi:hypothetical protein
VLQVTFDPLEYRRGEQVSRAIGCLLDARDALRDAVAGDMDDTRRSTIEDALEQLGGIESKLSAIARAPPERR